MITELIYEILLIVAYRELRYKDQGVSNLIAAPGL